MSYRYGIVSLFTIVSASNVLVQLPACKSEITSYCYGIRRFTWFWQGQISLEYIWSRIPCLPICCLWICIL